MVHPNFRKKDVPAKCEQNKNITKNRVAFAARDDLAASRSKESATILLANANAAPT
jgi:hypothetical protein